MTVLNALAIIVTVVWAANFVATVLVRGYDGSAINSAFPIIMGAILAIKAKDTYKESKDRSDDDDEDISTGAAP